MKRYVMALDQGTTSSRAIVFDRAGQVISSAQREFPQLLPSPGHVEHDPEAIWESQLAVARDALTRASATAADLAAVGVTNQRETTVLWDRATGRPVAPAIVWQSRISAPWCQRWKDEGLESTVRAKTGLVLDAYFSASKIAYLFERHPGLRERAERGDVLFGTIDTFLVWRLTGGRLHVTDPSNASRTLLYNIHSLDWDDELLRRLGVPRAMLPDVRNSSEVVGVVAEEWLGGTVPIGGLAGDQQAATFGQACFEPGSAKNTYGTGAFLLLNTGERPVASSHQLLTTIGWRIGERVTYCLEGSIFVAGALIQWLRDELRLIERSADIEQLAAQVPDSAGVCIVPAFTGLGAPHWDPAARGTILGLTRGASAAHLARAALEAICFQVDELLGAMRLDARVPLRELKVDGGGAVNDLLLQIQADLTGLVVRRPQVRETTSLGAAYLAGLATGFWSSLDDIRANWALDREFSPSSPESLRETRRATWREAVRRAAGWANFT